MKKKEYHQSEVQTFLKCGKQWEFRYLRGLKTPPKSALTIGSAVDSAVNTNLVEKVKTGALLSKEAVLDFYSADFEKRAVDTEWAGDDKGEQKDIGAKLTAIHCDSVAPKINPVTVQEKFSIELDEGFDIGGTLDLTDQEGRIRDTKTTSRQQAGNYSVSGSLQPAIYDFAYEVLKGKPSTGFTFDLLVKPTKTLPAESRELTGKVTNDDRLWLFDAIKNMHKAIEAGVALPAPENAWWCSKDWCGYWSICKGKKT